MLRIFRWPACFVFCLGITFAIQAHELSELQCVKSHAFFAPADSSAHRKYAPNREIDILHLAIDATPDFKQRTVSGKTTIRFKPIAKLLQEIRLDGVDLTVTSVEATEKVRSFQATENKVIVTFENPLPADKETSVTIAHSAEPRQGLYFRTPEMGYKEGEAHLFTQGEAIEARHWYPCYDAPNEKFTSEITCRVPEGMVVLSNGRLISQEKEAGSDLIAVRWLQEKPHVNYLISLVAGYFKKVEDKYGEIPLAFYTPPSDINEAMNSFRDTKDMMAYFEEEIGVPYPWPKYYQVCVNDFVAGGMENTSITTLTDRTLFTAASENIQSSEGLVAHELAHQWFGDLVTCKDWSHLWLNEGFATYYAHLYAGHKHGREEMLYGLYSDAKEFIDRTDDTKPIVYRKFDSPMEQFSYLAYPKGSWVLHMLRSQLGDRLYRRCIKTYLERHQFDNVVTEDLNSIIEELSGRSFDQFFDQWVYHAHHPELDVSYSWDAKAKLAKVSIAQNQKLSESVLLFNFPLTIRFKSQSGSVDREIIVKEKSEDFYFPLSDTPENVRVDPELTLLAKIKFNLPDAMLHTQLNNKEDMIGRVLAVEQLASKKDRSSVDKLKSVLKGDPFYGVRVEAAKALRSMHTDEAFAALADSRQQDDARVRQHVTMALLGFYRDEAHDAARQILSQEKNPDIVAVALRALGAYGRVDVRETLLKYLKAESYRNVLAGTAIAAIRSQDDPAYIAPVQSLLKEHEPAFESSGFARGLDALAYLGRNEEKKDGIREFLTGFTNHKKRTVQRAALTALGTLGDPKAIPVLETFAGASKESPERDSAEKAISALRATKRPADDLKDLRNEVLGLKKENQDLRKDLDALKKRIDASQTTAPIKGSEPKSTPAKKAKR
jgi:aminopeptidase N